MARGYSSAALAAVFLAAWAACSSAYIPSGLPLKSIRLSNDALSTQASRGLAMSPGGPFGTSGPYSRRARADGFFRPKMATMDDRRGGGDPLFGDQSGDNADTTEPKPISSEALSVGSIWMDGEADGKDPDSNTLVVSDMLLLWLWLERRLEAEVQAENFHEAATLKREMRKLRVKALTLLEGKIHKAADTMRAETTKKRRDLASRIRMDLEGALAEEDYERAASLQAALDKETRRRDSGVSPSKLWKKIDSVWLEGEINNKIQQLRAKEDKLLEDRANKLRHDIREALQDEDFARAAAAQAELNVEEALRDVEKMHKVLARECSFARLAEDKLRQDPIAFLEGRLLQQLAGEDYEGAARTRDELAGSRARAALADAAERARAVRGELDRLGPVPRLELELEGAVAGEDYERARELRDAIDEADCTRRLRRDLAEAERGGRYEEAEGLKRELVRAYVGDLSPAVLSELGYAQRPPKYRVGDVVEHVGLGYRGVVVGWHDRCRATEHWAARTGADTVEGGRAQRFYHVLPDTRHLPLESDSDGHFPPAHAPAFLTGLSADDPHPAARTTYVAESELHKWDWARADGQSGFFASMLRSVMPESPVAHPLVAAFFFSYSRGRYLHGGKVRGVVFYHMPRGGEYDHS
mmetsp:Transcript_35367/g.86956  ORF Transcript_35367/g.86956 Transcript_35367/m.86956 type:complete len:643 (+) Transcript_35367:233-2161(+)